MNVQISIQVPAFNSFGYTPKSRIAESYGNSMFNFLSICHTFFHGSGIPDLLKYIQVMTTWPNLENIMLNKISQAHKKQKLHNSTYMR